MQPQWIVVLVGLGVVCLGGVFFAIGYLRGAMMRGWIRTTGQVVNQRGDPLRGSMPAYYPTFRWRDQSGVEHRHTSMMGASLGPSPGKLVSVLYDPKNPSRGVIDSTAQSGRNFSYIGIAIVAVGVLGAAVALVLVGQSPG